MRKLNSGYLTKIQNRDVKDIFFTCVDGLTLSRLVNSSFNWATPELVLLSELQAFRQKERIEGGKIQLSLITIMVELGTELFSRRATPRVSSP